MTQSVLGLAIVAVVAAAIPDASAPTGMVQATVTQQRRVSLPVIGNKERRSKMAKDWASGKCEGITRVEGLDGQADSQIAKLLGEPERKETFRLGDRPDEFHITLQNHYPLKNAANRDVQMQEWTWTKGACRLTVWLHKKNADWVGLENIRYSTDAEF